MKNRVAIVYHSQDVDGFMSALLLEMLYGENHYVKMIPYNYEEQSEFMESINFDEYVFGDVTPPLTWFKNNLDKRITIYDHHKMRVDKLFAAIAEVDGKHFSITKKLGIEYSTHLRNINGNINIYFSEKLSGCGIVFYREKQFLDVKNIVLLQSLVDAISLYDTWQFVNYDLATKNNVLNAQTALGQYRTFDEFSVFVNKILMKKEYLHDLEAMYVLQNEGAIINNFQTHQIKEQIKNGSYRKNTDLCNVFLIETKHLCYFTQEQIFEKHIDVDYIIGFHFKNNFSEMQFSMRSKQHSNVAELCEKIGAGGGHAKAGGFTLDVESGFEFINGLVENLDK